MSLGSIYKSEKEIKERKAEIKKRDKKRKSPEQNKKEILKYLKTKQK